MTITLIQVSWLCRDVPWVQPPVRPPDHSYVWGCVDGCVGEVAGLGGEVKRDGMGGGLNVLNHDKRQDAEPDKKLRG